MRRSQDFFLKRFMDKNKVSLSSLALDLKRVALGYHRGSKSMAERFLEEAIKRRGEIDTSLTKPYVKRLLGKLDNFKREKDEQKKAEDALMYSTLFQNASLH